MSRNLLDHARENRDMLVLKEAFKSIGCDCDFDDINGAAEAVRKLSTVPTVVNAALMAGPGIKVTPIERKGYKISANDEAQLASDINDKYRKGTPIHNVLREIIHHDIPKATKMAIRAPRVTDITVFKVYDDGIDYYDNPYFKPKGQGRKSGLQPCAWYIKIYTVSQVEPLYVCLSPIVEDLRKGILLEARREADHAVRATLKRIFHHGPHHPGHCKPNWPDFPNIPDESTPDRPIVTECPLDPNEPHIKYDEPTGCPVCDKDNDFNGYAGDDNFGVDYPDFGEDEDEDNTNDGFTDFLNQLSKDDE